MIKSFEIWLFFSLVYWYTHDIQYIIAHYVSETTVSHTSFNLSCFSRIRYLPKRVAIIDNCMLGVKWMFLGQAWTSSFTWPCITWLPSPLLYVVYMSIYNLLDEIICCWTCLVNLMYSLSVMLNAPLMAPLRSPSDPQRVVRFGRFSGKYIMATIHDSSTCLFSVNYLSPHAT